MYGGWYVTPHVQTPTRLPNAPPHLAKPLYGITPLTPTMPDITKKRRPPKTTYSRKPQKTTSPHAPKRRRLLPDNDDNGNDNDTTPSSPPRSSPIPPTSDLDDTPASSPPRSSPPLPKKKPTFSFFTRSIPPRRTTKPPPSKQKPKQKLTQSIIDLGQALRTTCKVCGMSYHLSTPDDESLHKRFHAKSVGGVDFPPGVKGKVIWKGSGEEEVHGEVKVLVVDKKSSVSEKRKAREVMEVVDVELGAGEITDTVLWEEGAEGERFKVYLYIQGKKCIGLLLAERITKAFYVLKDTPPKVEGGGDSGETKASPTASSSISISSTPQKALLGVSRIWTCSSHRRQGVAKRLLECSRSTFIYGMTVEKGLMAFSQPTESGGGLARGWFGAKEGMGEGWKVYVEEV